MQRTLLLILLTIFLGSCESENSSTNGSSTLTGILTGRVELYSSEGSYVFDRQGVSVSIDGTSIRVMTTAEGKWVIPSLPMGTYVLTFEKPGYGMEKVFGYQFTGGGTVYFDLIDLAGEQLDKIRFDSFTFSRNDHLRELIVSGNSPRAGMSAVLYVSTEKTKLFGEHHNEADVTLASYMTNGQGNFVKGIPVSEEDFFDTVSSGTTLYATMRILSYEGHKFSFYFDPIRDKWVYTSAGPISEIVETTVP